MLEYDLCEIAIIICISYDVLMICCVYIIVVILTNEQIIIIA